MIGIIKETGEEIILRGPFKESIDRYWGEFGSKNRFFRKDEIEIPQIDVEAFKKEFKALMKKYYADIYWACGPCSDLFGVNDLHVEVSFNDIKSIRLDIL